MTVMTQSLPDNVRPEWVVDFDCFNPKGVEEDVQLAWARLHDGPDIVWTPHNGGHWIATRAEIIEELQLDHAHFSMKHLALPKSDLDAGLLPLSSDPPQHDAYRKLIMPAFGPKPMRAMGQVAHETAVTLIRDIAPRGRCEFVGEFAQILPVNVFLTMADLPESDRERLMGPADAVVRSSDPVEKAAAYGAITAYISEYVDARSANPGEDVLSHVASADVSREESVALALLLLLGGLDTVASQLGFIARFLADNPSHRQQLIDDPRLIPFATEELLRRFSIVNTARVLTMDYEYRGIPFRQGDMIQLPKSLNSLDPRRHDNPTVVDFQRKPSSIKQASFGAGPHTCPGNVLARREIMIFLEEWLKAIPDFEVDPGKPFVAVSGMVNTVHELHLKWD